MQKKAQWSRSLWSAMWRLPPARPRMIDCLCFAGSSRRMKLAIFSRSTLIMCAYLPLLRATPSRNASLHSRAVRAADVVLTTTSAPGNDTDEGPDSMFEVNVRILGRRPYKGKYCQKNVDYPLRPGELFLWSERKKIICCSISFKHLIQNRLEIKSGTLPQPNLSRCYKF